MWGAPTSCAPRAARGPDGAPWLCCCGSLDVACMASGTCLPRATACVGRASAGAACVRGRQPADHCPRGLSWGSGAVPQDSGCRGMSLAGQPQAGVVPPPLLPGATSTLPLPHQAEPVEDAFRRRLRQRGPCRGAALRLTLDQGVPPGSGSLGETTAPAGLGRALWVQLSPGHQLPGAPRLPLCPCAWRHSPHGVAPSWASGLAPAATRNTCSGPRRSLRCCPAPWHLCEGTAAAKPPSSGAGRTRGPSTACAAAAGHQETCLDGRASGFAMPSETAGRPASLLARGTVEEEAPPFPCFRQ